MGLGICLVVELQLKGWKFGSHLLSYQTFLVCECVLLGVGWGGGGRKGRRGEGKGRRGRSFVC